MWASPSLDEVPAARPGSSVAADGPASRPSTRTIAGVRVPDTPLVSRALRYAGTHLEPYLFNHAVRSWLFAVLLGKQTGAPYDGEVLAVATLLHDLGLAPAFDGPLRFEVEGANAARKFTRGQGVGEDRCRLVWDSIALSSTPSIGLYKEIEVALCVLGVGVDWGGWAHEAIPTESMHGILQEFPRLGMKHYLAHAICRIAERRPQATYDGHARDFGERFVPGYRAPSMVDALFEAPFEE
ncbi:HD domain-containing protein [Luteimonas lutimaris]|uniref:HD domain-containing protein n=1 Tax=Luteimonas lutimaris TaxID=698645 RepID=A0ABP7MH37_9GAMM